MLTTSGPDTLQQAMHVQPVAVLLDLLMPGMDGWQTAAALKEVPETRDIPVIILSGLTSQEATSLPTGIFAWLCKPVEQEALAHALKRAVHGQSSTARVLVAEDDLDLAKVLLVMLQRRGIEAFYAQTGREAIHLSQRLSPDLLILDPVMPDGDGFSVVKWLRQQHPLCEVPLVVYSAKDLTDDERERLTLSQTRFFTKSRISPEAFEEHVLSWLADIVAQRGKGYPHGNQTYFDH